MTLAGFWAGGEGGTTPRAETRRRSVARILSYIYFYGVLLDYYDEHGVIPDFTLKARVLSERD
jgi:hypothetical protein